MIKTLIISSLLFSGLAQGQSENFLDNPGYEFGLARWSVSAGAFSKTTVSGEVGRGAASAKWDPSATSQTLEHSLVSMNNALKGKSCLASIDYKWDSGVAGDIVLRVHDGSDPVSADLDLLVPASGEWGKAQLSFVCPLTGSIKLQLESTADAAEITLDNAHLGEDYRRGVSAPIVGGQVEFTPTLRASTTDPVIGTGGAATAHAYYQRRGELAVITYLFRFGTSGESAGSGTYFFDAPPGLTFDEERIEDPAAAMEVAAGHGRARQGANTFVLAGTWDNGANYVSFLYTDSANTGTVTHSAPAAWAAGHVLTFTVELPILEWRDTGTSETVSLNSQGGYVDIEFAGSSYNNNTPVTDAVMQGTDFSITNNGSISAKITCESGTAASGTDCAADDEVLGFEFTNNQSGAWMVCMSFGRIQIGADSGEDASANIRLVRTSSTGETALESKGNAISVRAVSSGGGTINYRYRIGASACGIYEFGSIAEQTFKIIHDYSESGAPTGLSIGVSGNDVIRAYAFPLTHQFPQAIAVVGDVDYASNSSTTDTADTTSFVNSEAGSLVPTIGTLSAGAPVRKTVQFSTPKTSSDLIILEFQEAGSGDWMPASTYEKYYFTHQHLTRYGVSIENDGDPDKLIVAFHKGGASVRGNSTYGSFSGTSTYPATSGDRWRVKKVKAKFP